MNGYPGLILYRSGKRATRQVHKLVAMAFLPPRPGVTRVNHLDGDRTNNHVSNLEWATAKENTRHAWASGLCTPPSGTRNGMAKLAETDVRKIRELWATRTGRVPIDHPLSQESIARRFGVSRPLISLIVHRKLWTDLV